MLAALIGAARAQVGGYGGYGAYGGYGGGYGGYGGAAAPGGAPAASARRRLAAAPDPSLWAMGASGRALQQLLQAPTATLSARRRGRSLMQVGEQGAAAAASSGGYGGGYGAYGGGYGGGYGAYAAGAFAAGDEASLDAFAGAGRRRALRRRG